MFRMRWIRTALVLALAACFLRPDVVSAQEIAVKIAVIDDEVMKKHNKADYVSA